MKTRTKTLLLTLCALLLVVGSAFGTLAYLTAQDEVTNTFTVGNVKLKLDEAKVTADGVIDGTDRVMANEYKLLPGHSYVKDPTVTVLKDSVESYIRVLVTVEGADALDAVVGLDQVWTNFFTGVGEDWGEPTMTRDEAADTATFEFRYKETVTAVEDTVLPPLFVGIKVPEAVTGDQLAMLANLRISVTAHAIQADGFDTADAAWAAFH